MFAFAKNSKGVQAVRISRVGGYLRLGELTPKSYVHLRAVKEYETGSNAATAYLAVISERRDCNAIHRSETVDVIAKAWRAACAVGGGNQKQSNKLGAADGA
jgi:hypothetical protein